MDSSATRALFLALFILVIIATASVTSLMVSSGGGVSKSKVEEIVYNYLKNNPSAIVEAFNSAQAEQQAREVAQASKKIAERIDDLENDPTSPFVGNPKGDVVIVEFFDYNCGYCKRALPTLATLIAEDKNLKVVFKDFPILSEQSHTLSKAALAVFNMSPDKFWDFHKTLMKQTPRTDEQLFAKAAEMGIDAGALKAEMAKPEYQEKIQANLSLGSDIGIRGTPGFIIGGEFVPGAIGIDAFRQKIQDARDRG